MNTQRGPHALMSPENEYKYSGGKLGDRESYRGRLDEVAPTEQDGRVGAADVPNPRARMFSGASLLCQRHR